jgi:hypothetical protein
MRWILLLFATLAFATGCKKVGDDCEVTGDGFTRRDPCQEQCVDRAVVCPDGSEAPAPDQCAGEVCGEGGDCPDGQICVQIDSFVENSRCMLAAVCD